MQKSWSENNLCVLKEHNVNTFQVVLPHWRLGQGSAQSLDAYVSHNWWSLYCPRHRSPGTRTPLVGNVACKGWQGPGTEPSGKGTWLKEMVGETWLTSELGNLKASKFATRSFASPFLPLANGPMIWPSVGQPLASSNMISFWSFPSWLIGR